MKPVQLVDIIHYHPYCCAKCSASNNQRRFYIDLGIDLESLYNPYISGNVYLCEECILDLFVQFDRLKETYLETVGHPELDFNGTDDDDSFTGSSDGSSSDSTLDDQGTESSDSESSGSESSADASFDFAVPSFRAGTGGN